MRHQHRGFLAVATAATLVSGLALASAPAASAAPAVIAEDPGPHGKASPVWVTVDGFPETVKAGSAVEFTATLRNTADHQIDVESAFSLAAVDGGLQQSQLRLEFQRPGSAQWQDAKVQAGWTAGAGWQLDTFDTRLQLAAHGSVDYHLRLTFAADAHPGRAAGGLLIVSSDPTLPAGERTATGSGGTPNFTVVDPRPTSTPTPAGLPDLTVEGLPASFTAGGEAKAFRLVLTNHTGKDLRVLPWIVFEGPNVLRAPAVKLEFQAPNGEWLAGTPEEWEIPGTQFPVWLRTGDKEADAVALPKGGTRTVNVRLAFTKDAQPGARSLTFNGGSLPGAGETQNGTSSPKADFTIEAPAGATGTPTATSPATGAAPTTAVPPALPTFAPVVPFVPVVPVAQPVAEAPSPTVSASPSAVPVAPVAVAPVAAAQAPAAGPELASTGGGSSSAPMAITGATAIALGLGTLVVARHRRKGARGAGK